MWSNYEGASHTLYHYVYFNVQGNQTTSPYTFSRPRWMPNIAVTAGIETNVDLINRVGTIEGSVETQGTWSISDTDLVYLYWRDTGSTNRYEYRRPYWQGS